MTVQAIHPFLAAFLADGPGRPVSNPSAGEWETILDQVSTHGLMFLLHQLQQLQERYVLDAESYCDENLISHLYTK